MQDATDFTKLVPGFDFLQGLMKGSGSMLPGMGQWIAPTVDPDEIGRRIEQLRTVQYWLEQNARMLATTIQALEVQRMTLSTLRTMNLPLEQMREAFTIRTPEAAPAAPAPTPAASTPAPPPKAPPEPPAAESAPPAPPLVDPMQWWGALTQQFTELATQAMKETGASVASQLAAQAARGAGAASAAAAAATKPAAGTAKAAVQTPAPARRKR